MELGCSEESSEFRICSLPLQPRVSVACVCCNACVVITTRSCNHSVPGHQGDLLGHPPVLREAGSKNREIDWVPVPIAAVLHIPFTARKGVPLKFLLTKFLSECWALLILYFYSEILHRLKFCTDQSAASTCLSLLLLMP